MIQAPSARCARVAELKSRADRRADQLDAKVAGTDADWAEMDAADAIDYAAWAVDNARLAVLDALDARAYATQLESRCTRSRLALNVAFEFVSLRNPGRGAPTIGRGDPKAHGTAASDVDSV